MNVIYVTIIMPLYKVELMWFCVNVLCEQRNVTFCETDMRSVNMLQA
jgi:hypothetical protein